MLGSGSSCSSLAADLLRAAIVCPHKDSEVAICDATRVSDVVQSTSKLMLAL